MSGIDDRIKYLEEFAESVMAGAYTQVAPLGPNSLSKHAIKAKSITGSMIDVTNLAAVKTKTGSLSVDGDLTIATGGSLRSGKTSYSDVANGGYYIGLDSGTPKIRVGNIGHSAGFTWDGSSLDVKGSISATEGSIGGWIIGPTDLTSDTGATGIASSGSLRFWIGNTTPSSAPFRVSSAGALTAESGTIGGWTINGITGLYLGSGASTRGIDTGSTTFFAGAATPSSAPFKVTSTGTLTATGVNITGSLTASSLNITGTASFSGGSMTLPGGGSITSSTFDLNSGTMAGLTVDGDITVSTSGKIQSGKTTYGSGTGWLMEYNSGTPRFDIGSSTSYMRWDGSKITTRGRFEFGTSDYIENDLLHFEVTTSTAAGIEFRNGSNAYYSEIYGTANSSTKSALMMASRNVSLNRFAQFYLDCGTISNVSSARLDVGGSAANVVSFLISQGATATDGYAQFILGDSAGSSQYRVCNSSLKIVFGVGSDGSIIRELTNDSSGGAGSYYGRIPIYINGTGPKYLRVYDS